MKNQSQKNLQLTNYYSTYEKVFKKPSLINDDFLVWFIGFVEGDGSFFIHSARKQMVFSITQDKVQKRFQNRLEYYNTTPIFITYSKEIIKLNSKKPIVSYYTAWLSGFSQTEGGFYVGLEKRYSRNSKQLYSNYRLITKYHVSQQHEVKTL
jgi:hypothetical protein